MKTYLLKEFQCFPFFKLSFDIFDVLKVGYFLLLMILVLEEVALDLPDDSSQVIRGVVVDLFQRGQL